MPDNFLLYLVLVVALGIGYLLGRLERRQPQAAPEPYLTSLQQLVSNQRNQDVDELVAAIVAQDDGIDTRLALGTLIRRRGEVDKAIRVHQGLLARPGLADAERGRIELELARDYMAAGLLGRAENLLVELAASGGAQRHTVQQALLEIYQRERDWANAVAVGEKLARSDRRVRGKLAHFQCELAEAALASNDLRTARLALRRGAEFDAACARVSLIGAEVEIRAGRDREARRLLRKAIANDPDVVPQAVPLFQRASVDQEADYAAFLREGLALGPYLAAVNELAAIIERRDGAREAAEFVVEQLLRSPTLGGFVALLEHVQNDAAPLTPERLALVRRFSRSLLERQSQYRCRDCGFPSQAMMWQCPSCHEWGACKPIPAAPASA